jgi:hypothetical protein
METKVTGVAKRSRCASSVSSEDALCFAGEDQLCRYTTAAQDLLTLWRGDSTLTMWCSWSGNIRVRRCCGTRQRSVAPLSPAVLSRCSCCIRCLLLRSWWSPQSAGIPTVCKQARSIDRIATFLPYQEQYLCKVTPVSCCSPLGEQTNLRHKNRVKLRCQINYRWIREFDYVTTTKANIHRNSMHETFGLSTNNYIP